jgi:small subunit ribosomal protein S11
MAEETNPVNPEETKPQGEAGEKQPAAQEPTPKAEAAKEAAPKEAASKRPAAKKTAKPKKDQPASAAGAPENLSLSTEEVDKPKIVKAKGSKNVHSGVAHVLATFKGSRKSTAYAAQMVAQDASRQAMGHGLKEVEVLVRGPGAGRESAVRALQAIGLDLTVIRDVTPVPHNGCRPPKQRRV